MPRVPNQFQTRIEREQTIIEPRHRLAAILAVPMITVVSNEHHLLNEVFSIDLIVQGFIM